MSDLPAFLATMLDADEATARAADKARWFPQDKTVSFEIYDGGDWESVVYCSRRSRSESRSSGQQMEAG